jgi:hypothetical protein
MAFNVLIPYKIVDSGDMSSSITSSIAEIIRQDNVGIQLVWTGSPIGSFSVQVSIDHREVNGVVSNSGTWVNITLNPTISAVGSGDSAYIELNQLSASYIRVVYTASSGAGTLNAYICGKSV